MMFTIQHTLRFLYSGPVFVEPHTIRLRPRSDTAQQVIRFRLSVDPEPAGISHILDLEGNSASHVWFNGMHDRVTIMAHSEIETFRTDPFDFVLSPLDATHLPMSYLDPLSTLLQPYRTRQATADDVDSLSRDIFRKADGQTIPFLQTLCHTIARDFQKVARKSGDPLHPSQTLADRRGACRDLTVLFMEVCKTQGLATRFVSGYTGASDHDDDLELHAWAEVFLPGGGWRGYDPVQGVAVTDNHVALAASPLPQGAAVVHGTFRGTGVTSALEYEVSIHTSLHGSQYIGGASSS